MTTRFFSVSIFLASVAVWSQPAAKANLIQNPSFESGSPQAGSGDLRPTELGVNTAEFSTGFARIGAAATNWSNSANPLDRVFYMTGTASHGSFFAQIESNFENAVLAQGGLNLVAGTTYTLSFDLWATLGTDVPGLSVRLTDAVDILDETAGTDVITPLTSHVTNGGDGLVETVSVDFTPTVTDTYAIQFFEPSITVTGNHLFVDNVSLVPEPTTFTLATALGLIGLGLPFRRRRRRSS